jgi:translation initiation factor 3 subunit F
MSAERGAATETAMPNSTNTFNVFRFGVNHPYQNVQVHPLVVVAICDAYARRPEGATRSIGTLLGYVSDGNVIEISDVFTVNHKDEPDGRVMMDQEYHRKMFRLKKKVCPKESVIGWFSTSKEILPNSIVIHGFYQNGKDSMFMSTPALPSPMHLLVDTECTNSKMSVKCFVNMTTPGIDALVQFHEIPLSLKPHTVESAKGLITSGLAALPPVAPGKTDVTPTQSGFDDGIATLLAKLKNARKFTEKVVKGETKVAAADAAAARALSQALTSAEPLFGIDAFEQHCASTMQDTLMCVYLSNLARSQTALAEKINAFSATLDIEA